MRHLLLLAPLLLTGPVAAQDLGTGAVASPAPSVDRDAPTLASVDADGNGAVSRSEAAGNKLLAKEFPSLDKNADGQLDKAEFARLETEAMRRPDGPEAGSTAR